MRKIFTILVIILLLCDIYIVFDVMGDFRWWLRAIVMLPTVLFCVVLLKMFIEGKIRHKVLNKLFGLSMCIVVPTFIFTLFSLIGTIVGGSVSSLPLIFNIVGLLAAVVWIAMMLYGMNVGWNKVKVDRVTIKSPKIKKSFDGYKVVHLSDFHLGTYDSTPDTVKLIVDTVNSLEPDLIVFTGDLVNTCSAEVVRFKDMLCKMKARDGIYSVLGNHDYCLYREYRAPFTPAKELAKIIETQQEMGWNLLRNESVIIERGEDCIAVAGVDNAGSKMFPDYSDLPKAMEGLSDDYFTILLSHDPSHWRREVLKTTGIDLTLSGHTHAMQFKIGKWSPSQWSYREWGGLYEHEDQKMYVSTGIGQNIAFRFGIMPRIVLLTLESE